MPSKIPRKRYFGLECIDFDFRPDNDVDLLECLNDPMWRICSGALYKIIVKEADNESGLMMPFRPNVFQQQLLFHLHYRNIILKARQLGFTTLVCIVWLDHALFNANSYCAIVAQTEDIAKNLFQDKVKFAYDNLPAFLKKSCWLKYNNTSDLHFGHNNAKIRVAVSARSGTVHRLHISEFGKICKEFPKRAHEIVTGSMPAVPQKGITIIESTAEGRDGYFYSMTKKAQSLKEMGKKLNNIDYHFFFFAWHECDDYELDPDDVLMTDRDHAYFDMVEGKVNHAINIRKRAWYVATRDSLFKEYPEKMWQEYPSYPDEAFQVSLEGCYPKKRS